jgi:hypothetical protein
LIPGRGRHKHSPYFRHTLLCILLLFLLLFPVLHITLCRPFSTPVPRSLPPPGLEGLCTVLHLERSGMPHGTALGREMSICGSFDNCVCECGRVYACDVEEAAAAACSGCCGLLLPPLGSTGIRADGVAAVARNVGVLGLNCPSVKAKGGTQLVPKPCAMNIWGSGRIAAAPTGGEWAASLPFYSQGKGPRNPMDRNGSQNQSVDMRKSLASTGNRNQAVQAVACRSTYSAVRTHESNETTGYIFGVRLRTVCVWGGRWRLSPGSSASHRLACQTGKCVQRF